MWGVGVRFAEERATGRKEREDQEGIYLEACGKLSLAWVCEGRCVGAWWAGVGGQWSTVVTSPAASKPQGTHQTGNRQSQRVLQGFAAGDGRSKEF